VHSQPLLALIESGCIPILSPPVGDRAGRDRCLNANADLLGAQVAAALKAEKLLLVTSAPGVLSDPSDPRSALSTLTLRELDQLERKGAIQDGMKVKARAARDALSLGVPRVHVVSGVEPDALLGELFTTHGTGTLVTREPESAALSEAYPAFREARA
jgi:acetylglutamate kinase